MIMTEEIYIVGLLVLLGFTILLIFTNLENPLAAGLAILIVILGFLSTVVKLLS